MKILNKVTIILKAIIIVTTIVLGYGSKGVRAQLINEEEGPVKVGVLIEALQEIGYNNGDKTRTIPVVGVDAIPEAVDLIKLIF